MCHNPWMITGKVSYEGRDFQFGNLRRLIIQADGKLWQYDHHTSTELRFALCKFGYDGVGNWLKQWRKRRDISQADAAKMFGVSQSLISKIEKNKRTIPDEMAQKIDEDNRKFGRKRPY